jgi:hypothetical protein
MSRSAAAVADRRQVRWFMEASRTQRLGAAGASALTFVVLLISLAHAVPTAVRAAQAPKPGAASQPGVPKTSSALFVDNRHALKELQEALSGFAVRVLAGIPPDVAQDDNTASQRRVVESAKTEFQAAKGARELFELALAEYRDGIAKEEQAALEAELMLAQDELKLATLKIEQARERYAKIKAASKGSAYELSQVWRFEAGIVSAQLEERKARFTVQQSESKLKVLGAYSIPVNSKRLTADVEKARSEELARKAKWELEQSRLLRTQRAPSDLPRLTDHQKRMLTILNAAIPIEEQLSKKLEECEKATDAAESLRKEITALAGRLVAIVEEGRDAEADAALARLNQNLRRRSSSAAVDFGQASLPAVRVGEERPVASKNTGEPLSFVLDSRKTLRKLEEELLRVAKQAKEKADATGRAPADFSDLVINQEIIVKAAAASYENAKLTREVAEIGVIEYEEGIIKQDEAGIEGELALAESDLGRATDMIQIAKDRLAKMRKASLGSIFDLQLEFSLEDDIGESELSEAKAGIALAKLQSKLDLLRKFTKPKRIKELHIEVEKARAIELAEQAQWEREKVKLAKLEQAVKKQSSASRPGEGMRPLLARAISIAEEIKSKLDLAAKEREPSAAARKEITDLTARLHALIAQVPATMATDQWAALKPKVHEAALGYLRLQSKTEAK